MGGESLRPPHQGLEEDGYEVALVTPGEAPQTEEYSPEIVILELAEGAEVKRILEAVQTSDVPTVIALVEPGHLSASSGAGRRQRL